MVLHLRELSSAPASLLSRDQLPRWLYDCGIRELILCSGLRSIGLIQALKAHGGFTCHFWPEERSGAFFALGASRRSHRPVAIVTTSGTAAAELLPALIEAYYSAVPLLAITGDRPRRFSCTGAPQAMEQHCLFGNYTPYHWDLEIDEGMRLQAELLQWRQQAPAHLNLRLEDPVRPLEERTPLEASWFAWEGLDERSKKLEDFLKRSRYPFVIVGELSAQERPAVVGFLQAYRAPVYCEAISGLREALLPFSIRTVEGLWQRSRRCGYPIDGVIRLGGVPTCGLWRDLEVSRREIPLLSISSRSFPGASHGDGLFGPTSVLLSQQELREKAAGSTPHRKCEAWLAEDRWLEARKGELLMGYPRSEPSLVGQLSKLIPSEELLFLGNSLPIREWDLAASYSHPHAKVWANRGINGIDGQLSTFFGLCSGYERSWGLFGDLTTLYDMAAPWALLDPRQELQPICVVMNNGGAKLFARFFEDADIQTLHQLSFSPLADFWHMNYLCLSTLRAIGIEQLAAPCLLEIRPDEEATQAFWKEYLADATA